MTNLFRNFTIRFAILHNGVQPPPLVLPGVFSPAQAAGLIQGFYFSIYFLVQQHEYEEDKQALLTSVPIFDEGEGNVDEFYQEKDIDVITRHRLLENYGNNVYILVLVNSDVQFQPNAQVFTFVTELELREFLQGFLTIIKAFNIDPAYAIPITPIRGNESYNIQGIPLLVPR